MLTDLDVSRPRGPGDPVTATVSASWLDGRPVRLGAASSCRILAAGSALQTPATLAAGAASCAFRLPPGSRGRVVAGRLTVSAPGGVATSASFRFAVAGRQSG